MGQQMDNSQLITTLKGFSGFLAKEIEAAGVLSGEGRPDQKPELDKKPKGTVYKDKNVTDGAALWLKMGNGRNWKVIGGDTGWIKLKQTASLFERSHIKIRRVNDAIFYSFGGGQWDWFGIVRRGGQGFVKQGAFGDKGCRIITPGGIPDGFRTAGSQVVSTYKDGAALYGTLYLGGISDSNFIALNFTENIPTDRDINDIRISPLSYPTDQAWPELDALRGSNLIE